MQIVIDTNIWIKACNMESLECSLFVSNFLQTDEDSLAVDYDYQMMKEYQDNLASNSFFQHYIMELQRKNRISDGNSSIPNEYKRGLDSVGFHEPEDRVFLGRAYQADKYLVSEDSDYGLSPDPFKNDEHALAKKKYIEKIMNVTLVDGKTALRESKERLRSN